MSRSHKKTYYFKLCGNSDKYDKRLANRALRVHIRNAMVHKKDPLPVLEEVSNEGSFSSDGKYYRNKPEKKFLRK